MQIKSIFSLIHHRTQLFVHIHVSSACLILAISILAFFSTAKAQPIGFLKKTINIEGLVNPTSLQFGEDSRLYVSEQYGLIKAYTIERSDVGAYTVEDEEVISVISNMPNYDDDGSLNTEVKGRQVTGILVLGSADSTVIFVTSSDPRIGGGGKADTNLDTNSGIISKIFKDESGEWIKVDLVRGLPRSEENHSQNGLNYIAESNVLLVTSGGNTNQGAPSNNFTFIPEYAYSAAILSVHLDELNAMEVKSDGINGYYIYDLPTLDDETRNNTSEQNGYEDENDPFGGNNGKNQAELTKTSPVQIYSSGWRNVYDVVVSANGLIYTVDNGPNKGWGGPPIENCSNTINEEVSDTYPDNLHWVSHEGYYGGHPNPTRANRSNVFNLTNPQSAVEKGLEDAICAYLIPGQEDNALATYPESTNGLAQYTASNFNGELLGDLVTVAFDGNLLRYNLKSDNEAPDDDFSVLASGVGSIPLDVTTQGDFDLFPGTIWVCNYAGSSLTVFDPIDFTIGICDLADNNGDDDEDGYSNNDETVNGTNPCNPAHVPDDFDKDFVSDFLDTDDDNDNVPDLSDYFPLDPSNGLGTSFPFRLDFDNQNDGGIRGWGFTGVMSNEMDIYTDSFDPTKMTVGGAGLKFTIDEIGSGTAIGDANNQKNAFHFGIKIPEEECIVQITTRIQGPFSNLTSWGNQSYGLYIGTGNQDDFLSLEIDANEGESAFRITIEQDNIPQASLESMPELSDIIDLQIIASYTDNKIHFNYSSDGSNFIRIGTAALPSFLLDRVVAVGLLGSSGDLEQTFTGTWDFLEVRPFENQLRGQWTFNNSSTQPLERHENSFIQVADKFISLGGRGLKPVSIYDIASEEWQLGSTPPIEMHHFQAIEVDGLVYVMGAFTGNFPNETPIDQVYIYDVIENVWYEGPEIPRPRGAAGCVKIGNYVYLISGIVNGHSSGWVDWVDRLDLRTNLWEELAAIPNPRDHFFAANQDNKIIVAGGRRSGQESYFSPTILEVDIYDSESDSWSTLPEQSDLPTGRAGAFGGIVFNELIVAGGEDESEAKFETEALNLLTNKWRPLDDLNDSRHGTQAIVNGDNLYVVNGSGEQGGEPELSSMEVLSFFGARPIDVKPLDPAKVEISQTSFVLDPFDQPVIEFTIDNLSEENDTRLTEIIKKETGEPIVQHDPLPLLLPASNKRDIVLTLSYADNSAYLTQVDLNYSGLLPTQTIDIYRSQKSPKAHHINIGGSGGWSKDGQLFVPGDDLVTRGNQVTSRIEREPPFGTGVRGDNLTMSIDLERGLYDVQLFGDTIELTNGVANVFLESKQEIVGWQLIDNGNAQFINDARVFVSDGYLDIEIGSEDFVLSGLSYKKIATKNTSFSLEEDQSTVIPPSILTADVGLPVDQTISIALFDLPSKGRVLLGGEPVGQMQEFEIGIVPVVYEAATDQKGKDEFGYIVKAGSTILAEFEAKVEILGVRDKITLRPEAPTEFRIDEDRILRIPYYQMVNNPDNTRLQVNLSNKELSQWLDVKLTRLEGKPSNDHVGKYYSEIFFRDDEGFEITHNVEIEVVNINDAPILLRNFEDLSIDVDSTLILEIDPLEIIDVDANDRLHLTATSTGNDISKWVIVDDLTLQLSPSIVDTGDYAIEVSVVDLGGASSSKMFTAEVIPNVVDTATAQEEPAVEQQENEQDQEEEEIIDDNKQDETPVDDVEDNESEDDPVLPEEEGTNIDSTFNTIPSFLDLSFDLQGTDVLIIPAPALISSFMDADSLDPKAIKVTQVPEFGMVYISDQVLLVDSLHTLWPTSDMKYIPDNNITTVDSIQLIPFDGKDFGQPAHIVINQIMDESDVVLGTSLSNDKFMLYPNPADDKLVLKSPLEIVGISNGDIVSVDGRVLMSFKVDSEFLELNVSNLTSGYFILIVHTKNDHRSLPFILKR